VFDLFGTVAPPFSRAGYERMLLSIASCLGVASGMFRELWIENAPDLIAGRMVSSEASLRRIADRMHVELTERDLHSALEIISDFIRRSLLAAPAHLAVLDRLRHDGFRIGLLSNCSPEVPRLWPETPLASRFDAACFSCAIGATKPAPEAYLEVCRRLGVAPADCLYIGDGSDDELTAARGLGMHAVLLRSPTADTYDVRRRDAEEWDGDAIATLADIGEDFLYGDSPQQEHDHDRHTHGPIA
jgi:putative hydrolase of the HAD superfamily